MLELLLVTNTAFFNFEMGEAIPQDKIVVITDGYHFDVGFEYKGQWHSLTPLENEPLGYKSLEEKE